MKLKYYLRGVGIGVIVTTLIFMISISIHKDDTAAKDTDAGQDIGQTVAEANKLNTESIQSTETPETQAVNSEMPSSEEIEAAPSPDQPADPNAASPETLAAPEGTEAGTAPAAPFTVGKGEYSDSIAKRLQELALVDNADAFNKFLIEKNYDNFILPGTYTIPLDSTYEEIAALLTTKVDAAAP